MRDGTCAKCGSATVRAARNAILMGERPRTYLRPDIGPGFRGMVRNHETDLWIYGCTHCGYLELYLIDPDAIRFVEEHWSEVPVAPGT